MITNFEEITEDLTPAEVGYIEDVKQYLEKIMHPGNKQPVKQKDIVDQLNYLLGMEHGQYSIKMSSCRLRKFFNYFRTKGILPIIATSEGCYITNDREEIERQILSLKQRAQQILRASEGLHKFLA